MNDREMNQISQCYAILVTDILDVTYYITEKVICIWDGMWTFSNVMPPLWG